MSEELTRLVSQFTLLAIAGYVLYKAFGDRLPKAATNNETPVSGTAPLVYGQTRL